MSIDSVADYIQFAFACAGVEITEVAVVALLAGILNTVTAARDFAVRTAESRSLCGNRVVKLFSVIRNADVNRLAVDSRCLVLSLFIVCTGSTAVALFDRVAVIIQNCIENTVAAS